MKFCDISSFYSRFAGGIRTYHDHKIAFFERHPEHEYVLMIAGGRNEIERRGRIRIYTVRGFPVSKDGAYRQIIDLVQVRRVLRLENPDVIEVGSPYFDCWLAPAGRRAGNTVISGLYHTDFPDTYIAPAFRAYSLRLTERVMSICRWYVARAYGRFDMTIATSRHSERKLLSYGLTDICYLPLGVDTSLFHPGRRDDTLRASLGVHPEDTLLLFAGRFRAEKGVDTLLSAVPDLSVRRGIKLALAGRGPLSDLAKEAAQRYSNVSWLGFISEPMKTAALFASADIYVAPGPHETFGLAALEALSSGIPVAAAGSAGNAELVSESHAGAVFEPGNVEDLVRCVGSIMQTDKAMLKQRARAFVESRFSWERTFESMTAKYKELKDAKGIRPCFVT